MTDLLTRLESGSGADAALEVALCERLGIPWPYKPILTSLDAALSLVERMLPGSFYFLGKGKLKPDEPLFAAQIYKPGDIGDEGLLGEAEHASSQPRALLIALLRALDQEPQT